MGSFRVCLSVCLLVPLSQPTAYVQSRQYHVFNIKYLETVLKIWPVGQNSEFPCLQSLQWLLVGKSLIGVAIAVVVVVIVVLGLYTEQSSVVTWCL